MRRAEKSGTTTEERIAPWLGRWTAADPSGLVGSTNRHLYSSGSPSTFRDTNGNDPENPDDPDYDPDFPNEDTSAPDSEYELSPEEEYEAQLKELEAQSRGWKNGFTDERSAEWAQVVEAFGTMKNVLGAETTAAIISRYNDIGGLSYAPSRSAGEYGRTGWSGTKGYYSEIFSDAFDTNERLKNSGEDKGSLLIAGLILHDFTHIQQKGNTGGRGEYNAYSVELWFLSRAGGLEFREESISKIWGTGSSGAYPFEGLRRNTPGVSGRVVRVDRTSTRR